MVRDLKHRAAFEQHGETYVKLLSERDDDVGHEARAYLYEKQTERETEASKSRDAREEQTLALVQEANTHAAHANALAIEANKLARASMYAAIAASLMSAVVGAAIGFVLGK